MNKCIKCTLPETFPGIMFDKRGVCNYCNYFEATKDVRESLKNKLKNEFELLIKNAKTTSKSYDCIVCYSGGKDSTYLLMELKEKYALRILAYTFDNGFLSGKTILNIEKIVKQLNVEHVMFRPDEKIVKNIFRNALIGRISYPKEITSILSPLCAVCQGMILKHAFKLAGERNIPIIFMGFTPGQYPDVSYENFIKSKSCIYFSNYVYKDDPPDIIKIIRDPIDEIAGEESEKYYLKSQYLNEDEKHPHVLFPYHAVFDYDEETIYKEIKKRGWEKPTNTDKCSTNCLINSLGNYSFYKKYGYHPYIAEISSMVRQGKISYDEALNLGVVEDNCEAMEFSLRKLTLKRSEVDNE